MSEDITTAAQGKSRYASEEEALATCSRFHDDGLALGYFGVEAANYLVSTGRWRWLNVHCWGYILQRAKP